MPEVNVSSAVRESLMFDLDIPPDWTVCHLVDGRCQSLVQYNAVEQALYPAQAESDSWQPNKDHPDCGWDNEHCPQQSSGMLQRWNTISTVHGNPMVG